jgi:hypothetical protein
MDRNIIIGVSLAFSLKVPCPFQSGRDYETIAFAIFEHCIRAPWLLLWRALKFHAARLQFLIRFCDVMARIGHVHHRADPFFSIGREQHNSRLRVRDPQFNPALFVVERLICDDRESKFFSVKIQRPFLIPHGNAYEFDLFDYSEQI